MTIRIAHLYYDIMNLYGEIGNIKVLRYHLEEQGIKVIIDNLSINDEIDFNKYDLLYDNGILVLEYSNDKLKDNYNNLKLYRSKRYGDKYVTIYHKVID